jgi:hypothetical protein
MGNRKYIMGVLMFSMLILAGSIVKFVMSKPIEIPETNATIDATSRVSTPFDSSGPTVVLSSTNTTSPGVDPATQTNNIAFYISKQGNNTDGKSWNTAWNELDQIRWEDVEPGDTIMIGGGEYHTSMDVGTSGVSGSPITITTNGEQVVLDGQRPALPYCGESEYSPKTGDDAIGLEGQSFIVIDGQEWSGITIRNHKRGIMLRRGASNIIVRNVEIYDNGWSVGSGPAMAPDGAGVELGGSDILFERAIIHDNGQDAFQAGWGVWNFTLRNSWLYNSREHPTVSGKPFNYCSHTDALQIYDGDLQGPVVIENSIIGPSFTQGIMINNRAEVDNVLIKDTLFVGNANAGIAIQNGGKSSNWTLQNVTIVQDARSESWNLKMNGNSHQIKDSIFWGGSWGIGIFNWSEAIGNYNWLTPDQYNTAVEMNPMFVDDISSFFQGNGFADFNYSIQNPAIPRGTGSSITSVAQLFEQ